MSDFEDPKLMDSTESLLQSIENLDQSLKIIIILLMHLYQVAYYVTITDAPRGQLLYVFVEK